MKATKRIIARLIVGCVLACCLTLKLHAQEASTAIRTGTLSLSPASLPSIETYSDAQLAQLLRELAATPLIWPTNLPAGGMDGYGTYGYWSLAHPGWPPLPTAFNTPFWKISPASGSSFSLLDDVDYPESSGTGGVHAMDEEEGPPSLPGSGTNDGGGGYTNNFQLPPVPTNGLWLGISKVSGGLAYLTLNNATDFTYKIMGRFDISAAGNWETVGELFPTNTHVMPFTVAAGSPTNFFIWACDWAGITSGGNTVPEWWLYKFFGTIDLSDTTLDSTGNNTLLTDYTYGVDPNPISFTLQFTNNYVNVSPAYGSVVIQGGEPSYYAVLVNDTNLADASWQPYSSTNVIVPLTSGNGTYDVSVGLRGLPSDAQQTWMSTWLTFYNVPLILAVTNPAGGTVSTPMIQLQGLVNESLGKLTFDVSNAVGVVTNQTGYWNAAFFDTNVLQFTTNTFQCYDIPLTNGVNIITLHATDMAGNTTTTNFSYTLSYAGVTNAPTLSLIWPQNNTAIGGSNVTIQAQVSDATASVAAFVNGNTVQGLIERSGLVWLQNLPLNGGTNVVTITSQNAAGKVSTNTLAVVESSVSLGINPISGSQLNRTNVTVSGTISDDSLNVWVNGVRAGVSSGFWSASSVPVNANGTAVVTVEAGTDTNDIVTSQTMSQPQPALVVLSGYSNVENDQYYEIGDDGRECYDADGSVVHWTVNAGGDYADWSVNTFNEYPYSVYSVNHGGSVPGGGELGPPWEYALLKGAGDDNLSKTTQSTLTVEPSGQAAAGTSALYLVMAGASDYSFVNGFDGYPDSYWDDYYGAGDLPMPPEWLAVNGQALVSSGITNTDGSVEGLALISAPAGAPVKLALGATQFHYYADATFTNVLVYQLVSQCVATTPANQSRTNLGVGEQVSLSFTPALPTTNIIWSATGGGLAVTSGMTNLFTAPDNAAIVTVVATIGSFSLSNSFKVLQPSIETSTIYSTDSIPAGVEGAGMQLLVTWGPTNVSFTNVEILELTVPGINVTGYFTNFPASILQHNPNTNWTTLSAFNQTLDHASISRTPPPWYPGGFDWSIPVQWKVIGGGVTNNFPTNEIQSFRITDTNGTTTVSKLGSSVTRTP